MKIRDYGKWTIISCWPCAAVTAKSVSSGLLKSISVPGHISKSDMIKVILDHYPIYYNPEYLNLCYSFFHLSAVGEYILNGEYSSADYDLVGNKKDFLDHIAASKGSQ